MIGTLQGYALLAICSILALGARRTRIELIILVVIGTLAAALYRVQGRAE